MNPIFLSLRIVFLNWQYLLIAGAIAIFFWIVFNFFDQLLFFSPIVIFYLPEDAIAGFILSTVTSILLGIVISMNVYVLKEFRLRLNLTSLFSGSTLSILSSTCASCSSLGFLIVSVFGTTGVAASSFLSNYQNPLRAISVLFLIWAIYSLSNKLTNNCAINQKAIK